jgi:hypothetical protein
MILAQTPKTAQSSLHDAKEKPGEGLGHLSHCPPGPNPAQGDANRSSQIDGGERSSEQQNRRVAGALNPSGSFLSFPRLCPEIESESEVAHGKSQCRRSLARVSFLTDSFNPFLQFDSFLV